MKVVKNHAENVNKLSIEILICFTLIINFILVLCILNGRRNFSREVFHDC